MKRLRTGTDDERIEASRPTRTTESEDATASSARSDPVEALHRAVGNRAVGRLHERGELGTNRGAGTHPTLQRKAATGKGDATALDDRRARRIRAVESGGGGRPLPDRTRGFFEGRFGRDFGDVRVHTGSAADEAARSVDAEAFTHGRDVVFRRGAYDPDSRSGKRLLAHELTHVVQQRGGDATPRSSRNRPAGSGGATRIDRADSEREREADRVAERVLRSSVPDGRERERGRGRGTAPVPVEATGGGVGRSAPIQRQGGGVKVTSPAVDRALKQVGAVAGQARGRGLTEAERSLAESVFKKSVDYDRVRIVSGVVEWRTVGNVIFVPEGFSLDDKDQASTFVHEMTHVWQYQHVGSSYMSTSIGRQLAGMITSGSRNAAYEYEISAGASIYDYKPEQQASIVQRYFELQRTIQRLESEGKTVPLEMQRKRKRHERLVTELTKSMPRPEAELLQQSARDHVMSIQPPGGATGESLQPPPAATIPIIEISF